MKRTILHLALAGVLAGTVSAQPVPVDKESIVDLITKVNTRWIELHPRGGNAFWDEAAYHTGNIEAYKLTGNPEFRTYSEQWAEKNQWKGAKSDSIPEWKYNYGETDAHVLFGDWQTCFQTYIDLYNFDEEKDSRKIARAIEVIGYEMSTPQDDYLWWSDGLYMVMPVMSKLYALTGDERYLEKLGDYWRYANSIMHDADTWLYFRDAKYVYPKHTTGKGLKDFWARGDGWVLAAFAKVFQDVPQEHPLYQEMLPYYVNMANTLATIQQPEGYWTRSMLDPEQAPGPETSGTAFFTYGMLWGMNNGLLPVETFGPVVMRAWEYLTTVALQPDGTIGYVQPIGERAIPGQTINQASSYNFGTGAFLLAACEMARFAERF